MLSGAQLGITVTGLLVGFLAEPMVGQPLGGLLGGAGVSTEVGGGRWHFAGLGCGYIECDDLR